MAEASSESRVRRWWSSRLGRPLLFEFLAVYGLFLLYKVVRFVAKDQADLAFANADLVWRIETWTFLASEASLQSWALGSVVAIKALNYYYVWMHFSTAGLFLAWSYSARATVYPHIRRLFITTTFCALLLHVLFPLAPPRMLPHLGFVDTMAVFGPTTYGDTYLAETANQFAAMPSVHFAWSVLVAYGTLQLARHRLRWLVVVHPAFTLAAIILTGNHFWLDAVVGGLLVAGALAIDPLVAKLRLATPMGPTPVPATELSEAKLARGKDE